MSTNNRLPFNLKEYNRKTTKSNRVSLDKTLKSGANSSTNVLK